MAIAVLAPLLACSDGLDKTGATGNVGDGGAAGAGGAGGGAGAPPSCGCPEGRICVPEVEACIVDLDPALPVEPGARETFDAVWSYLDEKYGAFPTKSVDWPAIWKEYAPRVGSAKSLFDSQWQMARAVAAIGDGHTGLSGDTLCRGREGTRFGGQRSNVGACVERVDGKLLVYKTEAGSPFELGDEVIGFDGRSVEEALGDLEHQPRCSLAASTAAQADANLVASIMYRAEEDEVIRVRRDGAEQDVLVAPDNMGADLLECDGRIAPDGLLIHAPGVSAKLLGSNVLYVRLASFGYRDSEGTAVDPVIEALRGLFQDALSHHGMILDLRSNPGGSPLVYMAMASWLFDTPTTLFRCKSKVGDAHDAHGPPWSMVSTPDPTLHFDKPLAVLTNARSVGAADFTAAWMQLGERAVTVGAPSAGAFGNGILDDRFSEQHLVVAYNDILCSDVDGNVLEGQPPAVDLPASLVAAGIATGRDDVITAAEGWVLSQIQP